MRILMISPFPTQIVFGGVEGVASALVPALSRHPEVERIDILSLKTGLNGHLVRPLEKGAHHCITSSDRFELLTRMRGDVYRARALCAQLKPDLVHGQGLSKEGTVAVQLHPPSVVTVHGLVHVERRLRNPHPKLLQRLRFCLADRLVDLVLKQASLVVSTSHYDLEALSPRLSSPVRSIPNPVPLEFFDTPVVSAGQTVLFVGVIQPRKNVVGIVRAFAKVIQHVPQAQLRVVGPTLSESYAQQIKREIEALILGEHVVWVGQISQERLVAEYANCALLVMFSEEETSPMAVAQAVAIGKPVVASDVGGIAEMVMNGDTGYLVPRGNTDLLALRIVELLRDRPLRQFMGQRAKEVAFERCYPDKVANLTVAAYRSALNS